MAKQTTFRELKPLSIEELQTIKGGSLSGALFDGIGAIIDAANNFATSIGGLAFIFSDIGPSQAIKGEVNFNKNMSFAWDNTKGLPNDNFINTIQLEPIQSLQSDDALNTLDNQINPMIGTFDL